MASPHRYWSSTRVSHTAPLTRATGSTTYLPATCSYLQLHAAHRPFHTSDLQRPAATCSDLQLPAATLQLHAATGSYLQLHAAHRPFHTSDLQLHAATCSYPAATCSYLQLPAATCSYLQLPAATLQLPAATGSYSPFTRATCSTCRQAPRLTSNMCESRHTRLPAAPP